VSLERAPRERAIRSDDGSQGAGPHEPTLPEQHVVDRECRSRDNSARLTATATFVHSRTGAACWSVEVALEGDGSMA
jgi:hypothetical protein